MTPAKFNFDMYSGDSYSWRFILWSDVSKTTATDLTDCVVASEIRDKPGGTIILSMPCVVTLPNTVDISMTPAMYANCPAKGVWDLQITFPDGQVQTPIGGSTSITADVTSSGAVSLMTFRRRRA